jgi:molybdopterin molybdotransferase
MQALLARDLRESPSTAFIHPGDLAWWLGWPPKSPAELREIVTVWERGGAIVAWTVLDDDDVGECVDRSVDADELWVEVDRSLEHRRGTRYVRDDDETAIARLHDDGYLPVEGGSFLGFRMPLDHFDAEPDPRVRPVQPADDVRPRSSVTHGAFGVDRPFDRYVEQYRAFMASPAYPLGWDLVAWAPSGEAAACAIAWPDPVSRVGNFEPVATHPAHRRHGFASVVLREGCRRLADAGMSSAIVRTPTSNHAAASLYRSVGFLDEYEELAFRRSERSRRYTARMPRPIHDHDSADGLVPLEKARDAVLSRIKPLPPLELPLTDAYGCVTAADVTAAIDLPEFASSGMDGFAVRAADVTDASPDRPAELKIVGRAMIGQRPDATVGMGEAVKIATGAPVPSGADAVVAVENTEADGELVRVVEPVPTGRNVRPRGEDVRIGDVLVPAGKRIGAPEIGLLANAGVPHPLVHPRPRVIVFSTGDELVPPTETPTFGQVRDANAYTLFGALREAGAMPVMAGIVRDDPEQLKDAVLSYEIQADAFVSSGGVSVGERDVVKAAFSRQGDVGFSKVAMQPGMPQGFGFLEGKPFFGLPGNPVSVFVSFEMFVRPAILKMMGRATLSRPEVSATLTEEIAGPKDKTVFLRVAVSRGADGWSATPTGGRGSNLISTVARANGLAVLPPGVASLAAGERVTVLLFRANED